MKRLKMKFGEQEIIACALSVRETLALQDEQENLEQLRLEHAKIAEIPTETRTPEQKAKFRELNRKQMQFTTDIVRQSFAKMNRQFQVDPLNPEQTVEKINDRILDNIDIDQLSKLCTFAMSGSYEKDEELIDLTK